jgi:hypothetical protein
MGDQGNDDFDVDRVEDEKEGGSGVKSSNLRNRENRSDYMRDYRQRPEVIKSERLRLLLKAQQRRDIKMLKRNSDEVYSYLSTLPFRVHV